MDVCDGQIQIFWHHLLGYAATTGCLEWYARWVRHRSVQNGDNTPRADENKIHRR